MKKGEKMNLQKVMIISIISTFILFASFIYIQIQINNTNIRYEIQKVQTEAEWGHGQVTADDLAEYKADDYRLYALKVTKEINIRFINILLFILSIITTITIYVKIHLLKKAQSSI